MANALKLVQTSPASNPDTNLVQVTVSGDYTSGTPDPLPLADIADPQALNQVPLNNVGAAPPPGPGPVWAMTHFRFRCLAACPCSARPSSSSRVAARSSASAANFLTARPRTGSWSPGRP